MLLAYVKPVTPQFPVVFPATPPVPVLLVLQITIIHQLEVVSNVLALPTVSDASTSHYALNVKWVSMSTMDLVPSALQTAQSVTILQPIAVHVFVAST